MGDGTGAAAAYKDALALDPKLTEASVNLSALLLDQKDAAGALSAAEIGLKTVPKQPDLLLNRALALEASGKKEESLKAYGAAVAAAPDNIDLRIAYAELLTAAKDEKGALEQLRAVSTTDDPKLLDKLAQKVGRLTPSLIASRSSTRPSKPPTTRACTFVARSAVTIKKTTLAP